MQIVKFVYATYTVGGGYGVDGPGGEDGAAAGEYVRLKDYNALVAKLIEARKRVQEVEAALEGAQSAMYMLLDTIGPQTAFED